MRATLPFVERKFAEFNTLIFKGELPPVPVELSRATRTLGMCVCKKRKDLLGCETLYDFRLRISTSMDLTEQELEDVIIHEMIHYYIGVNRLKDTSAHGRLFRSMMNTINTTFGRHLTISHRSTPEQQASLVSQRNRYHVIALVTFVDGRCGVKVLPRILQRILTYYNKVKNSKEVKVVDLYMSNDVYFNRFPCSSVLKVHIVEKNEVCLHLKDAEHLACDGKRIVRS